MYDVIIIGAGPAGLTAGANTAHRGLKSLIIEKQDVPGGLPKLLYPDKIIRDHPGFPVGILGKELSRMLVIQAQNAGAEIKVDEEVLKINRINDDRITVTTLHHVYNGKRVIVCTGIYNVPKKLEGLEHYSGSNVHYKVENSRHFKDKNVIIVGGGDHAFDTALQLNDMTDNILILVKEEYAKAKQSSVKLAAEIGIQVYYNTEISRFIKNRSGIFTRIQLTNSKTGETQIIKADELFIAIGFQPIRNFLETNDFKVQRDGSLSVDKHFQTSIQGIFAAGDITGEIRLISTACAEGIVAAVHAFEEIKKPYWL